MAIDFSRALEITKEKTRVLILGAYSKTKTEKNNQKNDPIDRLNDLKSFLIQKGFILTKIVKDWNNEEEVPTDFFDVHFRDKSFYYIENWADILIFVFFENCSNVSAIREWGHTVDVVPKKINQSIILRHESIDLHCIIRGDIKDNRVFEEKFIDDHEIHDFAFNGCISILYRLRRKNATGSLYF